MPSFSLGARSEDLAELYAPTFIVGGPRGSQAFKNDSQFVEWLGQVGDVNRRRGMVSLAPVTI